MDAARQVVCDAGIAGASARVIATSAQVNQALVFYHFHTVSELIAAASDRAVDAAIAHYRPLLGAAVSLDELVAVAGDLQLREREIGNVTFMAQILSAAGHDEILARAARHATTAWAGEVRVAIDRVLAANPIAELLDVDGLAHLVTAGFVGLELYDGADHEGATKALASLGAVAQLVDYLGSLGPVARRIVRTAARREP